MVKASPKSLWCISGRIGMLYFTDLSTQLIICKLLFTIYLVFYWFYIPEEHIFCFRFNIQWPCLFINVKTTFTVAVFPTTYIAKVLCFLCQKESLISNLSGETKTSSYYWVLEYAVVSDLFLCLRMTVLISKPLESAL